MKDVTKTGNFTIKVPHIGCFPNGFTYFLRKGIDMLMTNLLLVSRSGESNQNLSKEQDILLSLQQ